ncbi:MAG: ScpA family protein [Patescibacteria group bacterium]
MIQLKLDKFEGPLSLLLELIEQNQLDITQVSLAQVTDQYLNLVESENLPLFQLADFLVVASRLLLIKSKVLLPFLDLTEEEEQEAKELELALKEYQRYKEQTKKINQLFQAKNLILSRQLWQGRQAGFSPPQELNLNELEAAFISLLNSLEKFILPKQTGYLEKAISVEEKIQQILKKVENQAVLSFNSLVSGQPKKIDLIINFLALLFLFRQKIVFLEQKTRFKEIKISKLNHNGS